MNDKQMDKQMDKQYEPSLEISKDKIENKIEDKSVEYKPIYAEDEDLTIFENSCGCEDPVDLYDED